MSSDSAVTYTSVHSEARSWSIPFEDPYEEAARQLLEQAPRPSEYVPDPIELEDHVPVYIPEPEHPEDLVPAEDEAPIEPYITEVASAPTPPLPPPSLLPTLIQPPHTRAAMAQRRATTPSIYHSLLPAGTPPLLPIPLPAPSTSRRSDIPEADTPPQKRLLLTAPTPRVEVGENSAAAAARQPRSTMACRVDHSFVDIVDTREAQEDRADVRAEIEILRRERLAYEQESIETSQALARTMATVNQGMSVEEIEQIVAQRVANAIEAIAIYESINQTKQQENKVAGNASNKRKWESDHNGSSNQQHKGHKKKYATTLPLCTKCNYHHKGQCAPKCNICKKIGHLAQNYRTPAAIEYQRTLTCYECGGLGHYKRDYPELKNQNHGNQARSTEAREMVHALGGETNQDIDNLEYDINA
ncbi:putative reverse transcriptase domain-containing protein [Tanacetum coccineum]